MKKILLMTAIVFLVLAGTLNAQRATRNTSARQATQQTRIAQGISSKELTRHETARLQREQQRIQIEKRIAKADGKVTPREKRFLRREQNRASRHIRKEKTDKQARGLQ